MEGWRFRRVELPGNGDALDRFALPGEHQSRWRLRTLAVSGPVHQLALHTRVCNNWQRVPWRRPLDRPPNEVENQQTILEGQNQVIAVRQARDLSSTNPELLSVGLLIGRKRGLLYPCDSRPLREDRRPRIPKHHRLGPFRPVPSV